MGRVGLYLSGCGSLDGSDVYLAVLSQLLLEETGHTCLPLGRDVEQGGVRNHRLAGRESDSRNALDEAARIVRGDVRDCRDVDAETLDAAVLVGGGGALSTWTDYHERGSDLRVTERLKFHLLGLYRARRPILCLDSAVLPAAFVLREPAEGLTLNPGNGPGADLIASWNVTLSDRVPCWDDANRVGTLPDLLGVNELPVLRDRLHELFVRAGLDELPG